MQIKNSGLDSGSGDSVIHVMPTDFGFPFWR